MLEANPSLDLHIDVSIDGLPELHDEIRGVPGLFNRAIET
jgi:MoaA/NifB/PqqE/SkfB family radical SAM enzyme